jgi:hypothetical protein
MKKQIENFISAIQRNELAHNETFFVSGERVVVNLMRLSLDCRGECYSLFIKTDDECYRTIEHYGAKHYIRGILKQWLNGKRELRLFDGEYKTTPMLLKKY